MGVFVLWYLADLQENSPEIVFYRLWQMIARSLEWKSASSAMQKRMDSGVAVKGSKRPEEAKLALLIR